MTRPLAFVLLLVATCAFAAACTAPDAGPEAAPSSSVATPVTGPIPASPGAAAPHCGSCGEDACGSTDAVACGDDTSPAGEPSPAVAPALRRVASQEVCMRSNRFLGKSQLSAEVEGHTYFGCCSGCNQHLRENAAARQAKDPVTGKVVDKASAVIGARPDGSVVYFESQETFARAGGA